MTLPDDDDQDDYLEQARDDPVLGRVLDNFSQMSDSQRGRFLRLVERVAALPMEVQATLTQEQMRRMMENDEDYRYN